jgi:hypothetical protein
MHRRNKPLLRVAAAIHTQVVSGTNREPNIELPTVPWDRCTAIVRSIRRARYRGWHLAAESLCRDLASSLALLARNLTALREQLSRASRGVSPVATVSDIYRDLLGLQDEFDAIDFDIERNRLSVTTEPIELEGVYMGPFEIELVCSRRPGPPAYQVNAKDPHPCESRSNVTHPHVMDKILCEGDRHAAIRQALTHGRLFDFFTLVAAVLRNYNPESPFVELALWGGSVCADCGELVRDDYSYACQKCGDAVCDECETRCGGCDELYCSGCISRCPACEEPCCRSCLKSCDGCQRNVCAGCLVENERCTNCHEENSGEEATEGTTPPIGTAV